MALHRISFAGDTASSVFPDIAPIADEFLTGPLVAAKFRDKRRVYPEPENSQKWYGRAGAYTGGEMPYTFLVRHDGTIDQCLALDDVGPHARAYNHRAISVAYAGDFRGTGRPTTEQQQASRLLLGYLLAMGYQIKAHDELKGGSAIPNKECPGKGMPMAFVREMAAYIKNRITMEAAFDALTESGAIL